VNRKVFTTPARTQLTSGATRKRKQPKSYGSGGYPSGSGGKPCPTCYAPMERAGSAWTCTKHGAPSKP
jgi:hypothetical protein